MGESTDVVQKEMYTFADEGEQSFTLRPEGTAPVCRAYLEHGMHKLPQPVKLWYLSSFFRRERPQAGRYRQFWQVGVEAIGSDDPAVDAEVDPAARRAARGARRPGRAAADRLARHARTRAPPTGRSCRRYLRAHEAELAPEVVARIDLNPLRAFDADHPGTRRVMAAAPRGCSTRWRPTTPSTSPPCARCSTPPGLAYEVDPTLVRGLDYYTRTVFEFTSDALGAQSGVGGGGRYDGLIEQIGGPPTPGMGWAAGVERMLLASRRAADRARARSTSTSPTRATRTAPRPSGWPPTRAARGYAARLELGGRSLKGQLKQADRAGARYVAILGDEGTSLKDMETGEQRTVEPDTVMHFLGSGL